MSGLKYNNLGDTFAHHLDSVLNRADKTLTDKTVKWLPFLAVLLCPGHRLELESF